FSRVFTVRGSALEKRPKARTVARTDTHGLADRTRFRQRGHHIIGGTMPRSARIRWRGSSSRFVKATKSGKERKALHSVRNISIISGNQVRCASPDSIISHLFATMFGTPKSLWLSGISQMSVDLLVRDLTRLS